MKINWDDNLSEIEDALDFEENRQRFDECPWWRKLIQLIFW